MKKNNQYQLAKGYRSCSDAFRAVEISVWRRVDRGRSYLGQKENNRIAAGHG